MKKFNDPIEKVVNAAVDAWDLNPKTKAGEIFRLVAGAVSAVFVIGMIIYRNWHQ